MTELITNSIWHRTINGDELVRRMELRGWNQTELARRVGCSQSYICQIARPGDWEITTKIADKILEVFKKDG